ncbi:hypothetical protein DFQ04_1244 [Algoriphagus boseongensis]|uniref:Uncharacterized protein n=1 Tax=Algoriphagus boseongensis TaxID=1442587 RepID=A0A4R6TB14_9BACT|nr:hypothetical protein [Algoriphagus boseongensis]TDQ19423.1 hypothetical protein DFQ04_1244 [Algoriphagus boseongensis]
MNSSKINYTGLVLEYDSGIVPPPYSHVFRLALDWSKGDLEAQLDLHYTEREELSEEEILDEGFTLQDDFSYKGKLNSIWIKPLQQMHDKTKWTNKDIEEGGISVTLTEKGKDLGLKIPSNQEEWQLMAQDLIQAIYETIKKEAPLKVSYRKVSSEDTIDCSLTVHFSNREVIFEKNGKSNPVNWEYAIQLMKMIFTPDYHYELAKEEAGKKRGEYIECGDGYWHELGKGVVNIDPSFDAVGKIKQGFEELLGE